MRQGIGWILGGLAAIVVIVALSFALLYWNGALAFLGMNIQRQVTQQSLQYVQSHQEQLMQYWSDYQTGDAAHQAADKTLICQQAPLLDKSQWPAQITAFVSQNCQ